MAGNKSEKNAPKNQEMQEITIEGELRTDGPKYLPPYYSWKHVHGEKEQIEVWVYWKGPMSTLLQRNDLKSTVDVFNPKSEKIKFNFKVGNDILGYAIYDYFSNKWQEGHISKILDVDNYMISVADKMKKIIDLLGKNNTRYVPEYELNGNVWELVKGTRELITEKNKELTELKAGIPLIFLEHGSISYKDIDTRADETIKFLNSEYYKECTTNKKVGVYKRVKRSVKKIFNKITGRENIDKLYKDIEADVDKLKECSFIDDKIKESLDISKDRSWEYFATINQALLKIINKLGEFSNFKLTNVWESRCGRVTTDSKTIKPILKQYGIIDPDDTLKEAAICRYVLKNLLKSQRDSKSKVDEETSSKVKLKEVLKKYKQVIDKFSGDIFDGIALKAPEDKVKLSFGKYVPNDTEVLMKNCEKLASYYKLNDLYSYSSYSQAANAELNKHYGEISYQNSALERIRTDSTRIAYCDKVLTELLKDNYKPHHQADEGGIGEDSVSDTVTNKLEGWFNKNQVIDNVDRYLDDSKGLISIGASDKDLKKWYGYVKGKIKDLNVVIKEYSPKISWDNSYWEEAKFISMLYILSRSVERADKNKREPLAEYLQELGANMYLNGKYIPGSIKDPAAVKKAAYKLYKVCTDSIKAYRNSIKAHFSGFTMNKKQCIKILDCISSTDRGTDIDADTMKNLRILEKKIKSKLKAN